MKLRYLFPMLILAIACDLTLNSNPPDYLKQFTVYKEGDGIFAYFILADSSGQMTTCDGKASIAIRATHYNYAGELKLFDWTLEVKRDKFVKSKIGIGAFQQEVIAFPIGRIPFRSFKYDADGLKEKNWKGKVKFDFIGGGRFFKSEETFSF